MQTLPRKGPHLHSHFIFVEKNHVCNWHHSLMDQRTALIFEDLGDFELTAARFVLNVRRFVYFRILACNCLSTLAACLFYHTLGQHLNELL